MEERDLKQRIVEFLEAGEGFKNETLENLNLSVRTYNCLLRKGIKYLEDANGMNVEEINKIRNLGEKGVDEFLEAAERYGYVVDNGKVTRKFDLEENQTVDNEEKILIDDTELSENIKRKLKSSGFQYISEIADNLHFKGSWVKYNKAFIEELEKEMAKYGYTLNKTGFFTKTAKENEQANILLVQLKKEGIKALNLIDMVYFKKDSYSMGKINRTFEAYLNFLVEEKIKKNEGLNQIEKEIDTMREDYKVYVDKQRQWMEEEKQKASFVGRMAAKNKEIRRYHHNPNNNHERTTYSHNPFIDTGREL